LWHELPFGPNRANARNGSFTLICSPVLNGGSTIHNGP
jgi:hypothetical protein